MCVGCDNLYIFWQYRSDMAKRIQIARAHDEARHAAAIFAVAGSGE